jgi:uncharacterized iron-regulated protein
MNFRYVSIAVLLFVQSACAHAKLAGQNDLYRGSNTEQLTLEQSFEQIKPGSIVIVSESHGFRPHHQNQISIINSLCARGLNVSVGMEFIDFTQQPVLDAYIEGKKPEADFLKEIKWGSIPFELYREQVLAPKNCGGQTLGINAPRSLTNAISKSGLESLSVEQRKLLPPNFSLGRKVYLDRFTEVMKEHVPGEALARYFEAQSVWDETMAYQSLRYIESHPTHVLVIIVGDFHASYGGGLPDRLQARGVKSLVVYSQINADEVDSIEDELAMHPQWGQRADFIFVSKENQQRPVSEFFKRSF